MIFWTRWIIRRRVAAATTAWLIAVVGLIAAWFSPAELMPDRAALVIQITAEYPGASASTIDQSVGRPIESALDGVPGLLSVDSLCDDRGRYRAELTFRAGISLDIANARVMTRLDQVLHRLPAGVQAQSLTIEAKSDSPLAIFSAQTRPGLDSKVLDDLLPELKTALVRTPGVGRVELSGIGESRLQVRLDPDRLKRRKIAASEVAEALAAATDSMAAGRSAAHENVLTNGQTLQPAVGLSDPERVGHLIVGEVRGQPVSLDDVAEVSLISLPDIESSLDGHQTSAIVVYKAFGANEAETSALIRQTIQGFLAPHSNNYSIRNLYDAGQFARECSALMILALLVMVLGILSAHALLVQDFAATGVLSVVLSATLGGSLLLNLALGQSLNVIVFLAIFAALATTLCDMLLLINGVRRVSNDLGASSVKAPRLAVRGLLLPILFANVALVSIAIGWAYEESLAGRLVSVFGQTLLVAELAGVASWFLLGAPMCAAWLRDESTQPLPILRLARSLFLGIAATILTFARAILWQPIVGLAMIAVIAIFAAWQLTTMPRRIAAFEDQGMLALEVSVSDEADTSSKLVAQSLERRIEKLPGVAHVIMLPGLSLSTSEKTESTATILVVFDSWTSAIRPGLKQWIQWLESSLGSTEGSRTNLILPPTIPGLSCDRVVRARIIASKNSRELEEATAAILSALSRDPAANDGYIEGGRTKSSLEISPLPEKLSSVGLERSDVFRGLHAFLGPIQVGNLNRDGERIPIWIETARVLTPEQLGHVEIRTRDGELIPIQRIAKISDQPATSHIRRHDGNSSALVSIAGKPGRSLSSIANSAESAIAAELTSNVRWEWLGETSLEQSTLQHFANRGVWLAPLGLLVFVAIYWFATMSVRTLLTPLVIGLAVPVMLAALALGVTGAGGEISLLGLLAFFAVLTHWLICTFTIYDAFRLRRASGDLIFSSGAIALENHGLTTVLSGVLLALAASPLLFAIGPAHLSFHQAGAVLVGGLLTSAVLQPLVTPVATIVVEWSIGRLLRREVDDIWHFHETFEFVIALSLAMISFFPGRRRTLDGLTTKMRILTVTGEILPSKMGSTLAHEHIFIDISGAESLRKQYNSDHVLGRMYDRLAPVRAYGGHTIVDGTTEQQGRNPKLLALISGATGLRIVTNTGYDGSQNGRYLPPNAFTETADEIAAHWLREATHGIGDTRILPGFIKIGVQSSTLHEVERKLVVAAAKTHLETGLLIVSDTQNARGIAEQIKLLAECGVSPNALAWLHAHRETDTQKLLQVAAKGTWLILGGLGSEKVNERVPQILALHQAGLLDRVLISQGTFGYRLEFRNGAKTPSYDLWFKTMVPALTDAKLHAREMMKMMVVNPGRAFMTCVRRPVPGSKPVEEHTTIS